MFIGSDIQDTPCLSKDTPAWRMSQRICKKFRPKPKQSARFPAFASPPRFSPRLGRLRRHRPPYHPICRKPSRMRGITRIIQTVPAVQDCLKPQRSGPPEHAVGLAHRPRPLRPENRSARPDGRERFSRKPERGALVEHPLRIGFARPESFRIAGAYFRRIIMPVRVHTPD
jgi:hypothetical protein